ncbi:MAG: Trk system potassium transporter TrkA [bacterium]|nr:Trk system potassium transporter TrkA [Bacillota bacterium]
MRIIVIGSGKLGYQIAEALSREKYDLVVIDSDSDVIERTTDTLDVLTIHGNGLLAEPLKGLGLNKEDLVIAVTGSDEGNILACMSAKSLGAGLTIARIRAPEYTRDLAVSQEQLCIDHVLNPDLSTAKEISQLLSFAPARQIQTFVQGKVHMVEISVTADNPLVGLPIKQYNFTGVLIAAIAREGRVIIPKGDDYLQVGDNIFIVGRAPNVAEFCRYAGKPIYKIQTAMIVGGSRIANYLAQDLHSAGVRVKIIEKDAARATALSLELPSTLVVHGDGTDMELLLSEDIARTDAFMALTGIDEENMVVSLLAKKLGVKKAVAKVNRKGYASIAEEIGIDSVVTPGLITLGEVLRLVRGGEVVSLILLLGGQAEVMEFSISRSSALVGRMIKDLDFPKEAIITTIVHKGEIIIPHGSDIIQAHDRVIVLTQFEEIERIRELFGGDERKTGHGLWDSIKSSWVSVSN